MIAFAASINAFEVDKTPEFLNILENSAVATKNFTLGLALGMQKTEKSLSKCYNSTLAADDSVGEVVATAVKCAFLHLDQCALIPVAYDQISVKVGVMSVDCKLPVLVQKLKDLEQPAGFTSASYRFFMYQKALRTKFSGAMTAFESNDFLTAGKNIGYIIRVLFDFTVTTLQEGEEAFDFSEVDI